MLRGIRIEDPVTKAWACGAEGMDIMLADGTLVNVPCSEGFTHDSPYVVARKGERYFISDKSGEVEVSLVPRPRFYSKKTSTNIPFSNIAKAHGSLVVITPSPRCDFFNSKVECRYCAGNFDTARGAKAVYTVEEVVETVGAVLKEQSTGIIYLSLGFSESPDGGMEFLRPYVKAVKRHFNCLVAVEALPPRDNRWIDETYAAGADSVLYNLEIFDRELFGIICPGRASLVGWKRYMDALAYAAKVFPGGTVASHLIVGLEPPGSTCMGIDALTDMGVVPVLPIYRPSSGKALRIEPLNAEIIIPVYRHLYTALKTKRINFGWVKDLSMVTTPVEARGLVDGVRQKRPLLEGFYNTRLGKKAAWGLSSIRRKLRVTETAEPPEGAKKKH